VRTIREKWGMKGEKREQGVVSWLIVGERVTDVSF
jgi:hypothetical protein